MFQRAIRSIKQQQVRPDELLIEIDNIGQGLQGLVSIYNHLLRNIRTTWVIPMADDDVMLPDHVRTLLGGAQLAETAPPFRADVVYTYCQVVGRPGWNPNKPFDPASLEIPAHALIRTDLIREVGGWRVPRDGNFEDYDLWRRIQSAGGVFKCIRRVTWEYHFHGDNLSYRRDNNG